MKKGISLHCASRVSSLRCGFTRSLRCSSSPLCGACGCQRIRWTCQAREGQYYACQDARLVLEGRGEEEAHGKGEAVLHHAIRERSGCLAREEIRKRHLVRALVN